MWLWTKLSLQSERTRGLLMHLFWRALILVGVVIASGDAAQGDELRKVSIAIASSSIPGGTARIAKEMGLFKKHRIDATVTIMDNGSVASAALLSGSVNFSTSAGNEAVLAQVRGQKMVSIANLYTNFSAVVVLAKDIAGKLKVSVSAPVAEKLKALDGLLIASPDPKSSFTFAMKPAVESTGAKARFTYMAQSAMIAGLDSGAVQGFLASSPIWATPVLRGTGLAWINGPAGELPAEFRPGNASNLNTLRDFAEANPDLIREMRAVFTDFAQAVVEHPGEVKDAIARLFPNVDPPTLDLIFDAESKGFKTKPLTREDILREISFVKASGVNVPGLADLDPNALLVP
jgi:ABC-type nitrate/sulfonate/bicarbonate transport system substrate-binding protein